MSEEELQSRGETRSHRPTSKAFREFMASGWGPRAQTLPDRSPAADYLAARHARVTERFPGDRVVIPAGTLKVRSNDTDYRFRAHSAFAHMTGLGGELEPDSVLVIEPDGEATLYFQPRASRTSEQFYADARYGEFWVGARPSIEEMEAQTGLRCAPIASLRDALAKDAGLVKLRVVRGCDTQVEAMVDEVRTEASLPIDKPMDDALAEHLSEIRLTKDAFEIAEMERAVAVTKTGFEEIIKALPRAVEHPRGERVIEGAFAAIAREEGNGLGYETIAAAGNHANTLHWMDNSGPVPAGALVLVDAGAEVDSLYTADITRTLPVSGKFSEVQARVYQAVLDAAEASLAEAAKPGARFKDLHTAAMRVLAARLEEWGILPVSADESLSPQGEHHRRWMPHGTSHHLGLDVHDCAQAKAELYKGALLEPGMIFTIEPGLYFRADDLTVPEEYRGIGVRIEDDVVIEADGTPRRLSEDIPRTIADVEAWMAQVQGR
ncbi:aminopeptidase P family protein [Actinomycetaceae bacterium WB03_NA08]|uniref:Xaa-Pro aminopeptidase n=1 Tax=Scrofimicrobium canadense TaxID=2652290 RepID=A0A6N7VR58_9ACTO|nr:aminopeptidase P family protein [Scrofimicrobium canadense]MSS84237.1 aminopeptidase P family protein [Scrofimicrobium canadense]